MSNNMAFYFFRHSWRTWCEKSQGIAQIMYKSHYKWSTQDFSLHCLMLERFQTDRWSEQKKINDLWSDIRSSHGVENKMYITFELTIYCILPEIDSQMPKYHHVTCNININIKPSFVECGMCYICFIYHKLRYHT